MEKERSKTRARRLKWPILPKSIKATLLLTRRKGDTKKSVKVYDHEHRRGDLYCVYVIEQSEVTGINEMPPEDWQWVVRNQNDIRPGGEVCILCPPRAKHECEKALTISPRRGVLLDIVIQERDQCTHCINGLRFRQRYG